MLVQAAEAAQMLIEGDLQPGALMMLHQSGKIFEVMRQEPALRLLQEAPSPEKMDAGKNCNLQLGIELHICAAHAIRKLTDCPSHDFSNCMVLLEGPCFGRVRPMSFAA